MAKQKFVNSYNSQEDLAIDQAAVAPIVNLVFDGEGISYDEIAVNFITKAESGELHAEQFGDPSPTDCMTFPLDEGAQEGGYRYIGDLFVCPAIAIAYAREHQVDLYEEVTLYLIHGLLHLCGYGDLTEEECKIMRLKEKEYLALVKNLDLWLKP